MKKKSQAGKDIVFEVWKTPVVKSNELWLVRQLFTGSTISFFFQRNHDSPKNEFYVLTISGLDSFRLTEEGLGSNSVGNLVTIPNGTFRESTKYRTFKVWNSAFAKTTYKALPIMKAEYKNLENSNRVLEYLIYTQDAWIEIIALDPPEWEFHKNIKLTDLVIKYLKEGS